MKGAIGAVLMAAVVGTAAVVAAAHNRDAQGALPAGESEAMARLTSSPRHGEWVSVKLANNDSTRAYVVHPQRSDRAPVVIVIHEIFGLSPWVRAVADQFAAEGFIAVAPDLLTMMNLPGDPASGPPSDVARTAIRNLSTESMNAQLAAVARYAMGLPSALPKYGVVGFCWGGGSSFSHAVTAPEGLGAAVVYYGTPPSADSFTRLNVPILGMYGGADNRVTSTVAPTDSALKALGKSFEFRVWEGAGHGFLRQQPANAANFEATKGAWPMTVQFFKTHLAG